MKRGWAFFSTMLLLLILPYMAVAAEDGEMVTYTIEKGGFTVSLPADLPVITPDTAEDDPVFDALGISYEAMSGIFDSGFLYLDGIDPEELYEITITVVPAAVEIDYGTYSDEDLIAANDFSKLEKEINGYPVTFGETGVYHHSQTKFLNAVFTREADGLTAYGQQYQTCHRGNFINITLSSYQGELDENLKGLLQKTVDSIDLQEAASPEDALSFSVPVIYIDDVTEACIPLSKKWRKEPLGEEETDINAKFVFIGDETAVLFYSGFDLWEQLSEEERSGYDRADADNTQLPLSTCAEAIGISVDDFEMKTYGLHEYYCAESVVEVPVDGSSVEVTMTHCLRMGNGYLHLFQFSGGKEHPHYSDFQEVMEEIYYDEPFPFTVDEFISKSPAFKETSTFENLNGTAEEESSAPSKAEPVDAVADYETGSRFNAGPQRGFLLQSILISLFLTVAIYSLPIFIYRFGVRKAPMEPKKAKKVTILYGIGAFLAMAFLVYGVGGKMGYGAIFLWSGVNYYVLTKGYNRHAAEQAANGNSDVGEDAGQVIPHTAEELDKAFPTIFGGPSKKPEGVLAEEPVENAAQPNMEHVMDVCLKFRTAENVKIYWEKTRDGEIRKKIPLTDVSLEEALEQFEESQRIDATSFGMCIYANEIYAGDIWCYGIDQQKDKMAMLSICIFEKSLWGKGVGSQAIKQFLPKVFLRYFIEKVGAFTYADNLASIGALKKAGFQEIERFEEEGRLSVYLEVKHPLQ